MAPSGQLGVAVAGHGYWGANIARVLDASPGCQLLWCCDPDPDLAERVVAGDSGPRLASDLDAALEDERVDAVAIATPVPTHAALAERVLESGRHCFVEKPLALTTEDARRVSGLASARGLTLMVGHLLEFHPAVDALCDLIADGDLGEVRYIHSRRLNLGRLRADENALWSLGAHDVSVILALAGELPVAVSARGESYVRDGVEDVVFCHLRFRSGIVAHMHLSWLDPHKERRLTVVGSKRMATFDDMASERKLTVFDKGFDSTLGAADDYVARSGDARSPVLGSDEPLRIELEHFLSCVRDGALPRVDGESGSRVVAVLEALQGSLENDGNSVEPRVEKAWA